MRYPLIDFHGNVGNIGGDGPAAPRYTEARLSKLSEDGMLEGLKKKNVEFIPNYDESSEEPLTLPAIFPNLLCNPNTGIGVAMACNWLPHNLKEVAQAIYDYMDGKEPVLPGPDFPTGGLVINSKDIPSIMASGKGSVKVRGQYKIEGNNIVFYEIPYGTSTEALMTEIGKLSDEKEIEGITNVRDESTLKKGLRIVIQCDKSVSPNLIVGKLFSKTNLQTSISYNQVALVDKTPTELNLKNCIEIYLNHNINCLLKECNFDLNKAKERLHIVEGLLIALEDIDNVIKLIKSSDNSSAAKEALMNKYNLSEVQAKAILAMRLSSLAHMEKIELENEEKGLLDKIADIENILANSDRQKDIIRERLENIVKKYGDDRRTELTNIEIKKTKEEKEIAEVVPEDVVVVLSNTGDVKKVPRIKFKTQKRNGKGVKIENTIMETISTNTADYLLVFSSLGKMYRILVDKIPTDKGTHLSALVKMNSNEKIVAATSLKRGNEKKYVIFFTKNGLVKKTELDEYLKTNRNNGVISIKLAEDDTLANVNFVNDEEAIIVTNNGKSIRFKTSEVNPTGRATKGSKGIALDENDYVVSGILVEKDSYVGIFTKNGFGKKLELSNFPLQGRGGKGAICSKDEVAGAINLTNEDSILIKGNGSAICISAKEIPQLQTRTAAGNIMIKNNRIMEVVRL